MTKVISILAVYKILHRCHIKRFNHEELNEVRGKKPYNFEASNRFAV
jgi:hypothetical protein